MQCLDKTTLCFTVLYTMILLFCNSDVTHVTFVYQDISPFSCMYHTEVSLQTLVECITHPEALTRDLSGPGNVKGYA